MPGDQIDVVELDASEKSADDRVPAIRQRQHALLGMLTSIEVETRIDANPQHESSIPLPLKPGVLTTCVMPSEAQLQGFRRWSTSRRR